MSAIVDAQGNVRRLDRRAQPDAAPTESEVGDASKLVRRLIAMVRDLADLRSRWAPRFVEFEDVPVDDTGTTVYRFEHSFGTRVRWWPVGWQSTYGWGAILDQHSSSDENTLALVSYSAGTLTVRLEETG